jgi:hypothetical protein
MFPNPVAINATGWSNDGGVRTASPTAAARDASVQPMRSQRRALYGVDAGVTAYTVYLPAPDPGVATGDTIGWGSRTLAVLAPARDEAGRGRVFAIDCQEIA